MTNDKNSALPTEKAPFWQHPETKSLFWTLLLILFIRGFIAEPFKIPSGSMIPTLLIGDHLFVAKTSFDIGIPFTNKKLFLCDAGGRLIKDRHGSLTKTNYDNV